MRKYVDVYRLERELSDNLPYKTSVKMVFEQADEDIVRCYQCKHMSRGGKKGDICFCDNHLDETFEWNFCSEGVKGEEYKMKINNITDIDKFFEVVEHCKGRVELVTSDGDRLNLKSRLCQYLSIAEIFSGGNPVPEVELVASNPEDLHMLLAYIMYDEI